MKQFFFFHNKNIIFYILFSSLALWSPSAVFADGAFQKNLPPNLIRVLAFDGGGIHGILSIKILTEIEKRAQRPIHELFDVIVGSSTGSIQAVMLSKSKNGTREAEYTSQDVLNFYLTYGSKILTPSVWRRIWTLNGLLAPLFTHKNLDRYLKEFLGSIQLKQTLKPLIISSYDTTTSNVFLFDSYNDSQKEILLKDIILASTSLPNIFPTFAMDFSDTTHYFVDSVLIDNNPIILALIRLKEIYPTTPKLVLSLGTGTFSFPHYVDPPKGEGLLYGPENWYNIISFGQEHQLNSLMKELQNQKGFGLEYYFRLNPPLSHDDMSSPLNASPENMAHLIDIANTYIIDHSKEIDDLVEILLAHNNCIVKKENK